MRLLLFFTLINALTIVSAQEHPISGTVDSSFFFNDPTRIQLLTGSGADGVELHTVSEVHSVLALPDGKILMGGSSAETELAYFSPPRRLEADGTIDPTFDTTSKPPPGFPGALSLYYDILAADNLGRVLVANGGLGKSIHKNPEQFTLYRLLSDGSIDPNFIPEALGVAEIQADGKIITQLRMNRSVIRLNDDGSIDPSFDTSGTFDENEVILDFEIQPDGKILALSRQKLRRLNPDGSHDELGFNALSSDNVKVRVEVDGKILLLSDSSLSLLTPDGSLDDAFSVGGPSGIGSQLYDVQVDQRGRILVCGQFSNWNGIPRDGIVRLFPNGTLDETIFVSGEIPPDQFWFQEIPIINAMAIQPDGNILVTSNRSFARLDPTADLGKPRGIDVLPNGNLLVTTNLGGPSAISELDREFGRVLSSITLTPSTDARAIFYHRARDTYFTTIPDPGLLIESLPTGEKINDFDVGEAIVEGATYDPNSGHLLSVVSGTGGGSRLITSDLAGLGNPIRLNLDPLVQDLIGEMRSDAEGLAFDDANSRLIVAFDQNSLVAIFDYIAADFTAEPTTPPQLTLRSSFPTDDLALGGGPDGVAFDESSGHLFLVNSAEAIIIEVSIDGTLLRVVNQGIGEQGTHSINFGITRLLGDQFVSPGEFQALHFKDGGFQFHLPTQSGRKYLLESNDTLRPRNWQIKEMIPGTNALTRFRDDSLGAQKRFYRLRTVR